MSKDYKMYNEENKLEYIKFKLSDDQAPRLAKNALQRFFSKTYPFEVEKGKDICNFNKDEIIDMYKTINYTSLETVANTNSQLSSYTQYCLNNHQVLDYQNHFTEINIKLCSTLISDKLSYDIVTRDELLAIAKKLPNHSDAFILLCLFEGIRGQDCSEIRQIRMEDFDGNILHLVPNRIRELKDYKEIPTEKKVEDDGSRYITVSDELLMFAEKANGEKEYIPAKNLIRATELCDEGYVIKRTQRAANCGVQPIFTRRLTEMFEITIPYLLDKEGSDNGYYLNLASVRNSGKIHFVKERCKQLNISPEEYVLSSRYLELSERFNDNLRRTVFWDKFKNYFN